MTEAVTEPAASRWERLWARFFPHIVVVVATVIILGSLSLTVERNQAQESATRLDRRLEQERERTDAALAALGAQQAQARREGGKVITPAPDTIAKRPEIISRPGRPPSDAQVAAAVADYFARRPVAGKLPTAAQVAAGIGNYFAANPPGPSPAQVAAAVREYLTRNPPPAGPRGETGPAGPDGRAPTADELATAVERYLSEHPLPPCPAGYELAAREVLTTAGAVDAVICSRGTVAGPAE